MKPKRLLALLVVTFFFGCNSSDQKKSETKDNGSANSTNTNLKKTEILTLSSDSAVVIASRKWDLGGMESDWKNAKSTSYTDTIIFDNVRVSVLVKFVTLTKDSNNNIIKDVTVTILKPNKNYSLSSSISDQFNMGTRNAFDTYVVVDAQAILKAGSRSTQKMEGKVIAIYAKDGKVEPL
jgi:hypothetical protein